MSSSNSQVILIAGSRAKKISQPLESQAIRVIHISTEQRRHEQKICSLIQLLITGLVQPSTVIADLPGFFALLGWFVSIIAGYPFILRLRGDSLRQLAEWNHGLSLTIRQAVARFVLRRATYVVPVTDDLARKYIDELGIPTRKMQVIPMPVDSVHMGYGSDQNPPIQIKNILNKLHEPGIKTILTVTNLNFWGKYRGVLEIIPIFQEMLEERQDVLWLIAGTGRYLDNLQKMVQQTPGFEKHVHVLGYVKPIGPLLHACDLVIYFSYEDALPNVVLEAQTAGKPIVVNMYPSLTDLVKHGETGFVVDTSTDNTDNARFISKVLDNKELLERIGKTARETVAGRYSIESVGKQFAAVLSNLK